MATSIDALDIQISAKATSANNAINRLTKNLDKLSTSLNGLNVSNVGGLSTVANQTNAVASGSTKMNNALKKTNATMRSTTQHAKSLASAFGKFYANYFLIIRGAKALWGSIEGTADYIEAYNYYNVAFGKIASEWKQDFARFGYDNAEAYADSFVGRMNETLGKLSGVQISVGADGKGLLTDTGMKNLGLNIQEITQYASQLASVTNSLGQTGETSLAISQSFTKLAGDISSLFNVDYSTVSKNLQSGLIGQSRALYKYGIDITNATLQTYAYQLGLTKAVSEMTQAEKQQLRLIAILDQSKVSWGDLANTINSPSNMIRQLTTNLKETGMVLGQLFIPMLEHVLPVVNGTTIALKRLLTEIAGFFGVEINFNEFGQGYNELEEDNSDLSDSYDDLASSIEEVKSQLLGFDEVNKLSDTSATLSVGTEDNTIDLTDEIVSATEEYQKVWDEAFANMENTSQKWADTIGNAFDTLADYLKPITDFSSENLENFYKSFLEPLGSWTLGTGLPKLADIFEDFMNDIDWDDLANDLNNFYKGVEPFVEGFGEGLLYFIDGLTDIGSGAINLIGDALGVFGVTLQNIDPDIVEGVGTALGILVPVILSMKAVDGIDKILDNAGKGIFNFVKSIASHPYAALAIGITTLTSAIVSMYDDFIENTEEGQLSARAEELSSAVDTLSTELSNTLAGIDGKYQYYENMAKDYLELSAKYDTLSENDKNLVKQYADELGGYSGEITGYINDITGEWEGTNAQLLQAIKNTRDYYKTQAYEKQKVGYYEAIAEAEIGLQDLETTFENGLKQELLEIAPDNVKHLIEGIDISSGFGISILEDTKNINYRDKAMNDRIQKVIDAYREYNKVIEESEESIKSVDKLMGKTAKSSSAVADTVGNGSNALKDILSELSNAFTGKDFETQKENLEDIAGGIDKVTIELEDFKIRSAHNSRTTLQVNTGNFTNALNYASNLFSDKVNIMNSKPIIPSVATANAVGGFNTINAEYSKKKKTIEDSRISPSVNSSTATTGFASILSTFNKVIGNPAVKVKYENDTTSLNNVVKHFSDIFKEAKITIGTEATTGVGLLGIKRFATGGFVDEGQLFIAREAGPELVGSMGGHTAVANNQQITDGIARAVYGAFTSALSATNRGSSGDIVINIDGKQVFKAVQRQANNYVAQTGQTPFPI